MLKAIIIELCLLAVCHGYHSDLGELELESWYTTPVAVDTFSPCLKTTTSVISLIPSQTECSIFYICFGGYWSEQQCNSGEEFDPEMRECVLISSTGCTASQKTNLIWSMSTDEPNSKAVVDNKSARNKLFSKIGSRSKREIIDSKSQKALLWTCPNNQSSIRVYPHEEECAVFYVCFRGIATAHFCEYGFEFDANIQGCSRISANGCTVSKTTLPPPTTGEPPVFSCPSNNTVSITIFPDRRNCGKFHMCFGGVDFTLFCDPGYEFSEKYLICVVSNSNCNADGTTSQWTTYNTTSGTTDYNSTTEDPWYTTTSGTNDYTSTTEDPWYTTSSGTNDYTSTTEDPWYTTSSGTIDYTRTTEDPWNATTSGTNDYTSTTEDPWNTTTSGTNDYTRTTEDPWYTTTSGTNDYTSTTKDPWNTTTSGTNDYTSTTEDPWYTTTSGTTDYTSTTEDPWYTTTSGTNDYTSTTEDPWNTATSGTNDYTSTTEDPWYTTTSGTNDYTSTTEDPWYTTTADPTFYPSTVSTTVAPTTPTPFKCPNNHAETQVYPDQYDCTKYYHCSRGTYQSFYCEEGYEFNLSIGYRYCTLIAPGGCTDIQQNGISSTVAMKYLNKS